MGYTNSPMELEIFAAGRANLSRIDHKIVRPKQRRVPAVSGKCGAREIESTNWVTRISWMDGWRVDNPRSGTAKSRERQNSIVICSRGFHPTRWTRRSYEFRNSPGTSFATSRSDMV